MAIIKCPECGKEISDKAKVCPNCGCPNEHFNKPQLMPEEDRPEMVKCIKCGRPIPKDMDECIYCGTKYGGTRTGEIIRNILKPIKIIAILLIMVTIISVAISIIDSNGEQEIQMESEVIEENYPEQNTPNVTKAKKKEKNKSSKKINAALYNDGLKIDLTGIDEKNGMSLYLENNSNLNLGVMTHALAINGYMVGGNSYGFNSYDVASGKKANVKDEISKNELSKYDIKSFDTMDVLFWAYDNDESFKSFDTNQIHVELSNGHKNSLDISGETLFEDAGIKVDYIQKQGDRITYCLTNTSGNYIDFTLNDLTINDYTSSDIDYDLYEVVVLNDCQILFDVRLNNDFLRDNNIDNISSVEFSLQIRPMSEYEEEWGTGMIAKNF